MKRCLYFSVLSLLLACEQIDHTGQNPDADAPCISSREVAQMLSSLPLGDEQLWEVHDAVSSSSANGYDEEYTMEDLFAVPGAGVGDRATKAAPRSYGTPLRNLIKDYLAATKAAGGFSADELMASGLQVYWPWFDSWDGTTYPAITFDPGDGSKSNIGYKLSRNADGSLDVTEIVVTEDYASKNPVWVVNANDDAAYTSIELLRRQADSGGGTVIIGKKSSVGKRAEGDTSKLRTLVIRDFTMMRNYDSWLCGGSEFFIKCGAVENFQALTEDDMRKYDPSITDFMICVKRKDVGVTQEINALLVDNWSEFRLDGQEYGLKRCAFLIIEDDGGAWTEWKIDAEVKIKSKTYGLALNIPLRSNDDIVWRGTLSSDYLEKYSGDRGRFGDVEITFEMLEK